MNRKRILFNKGITISLAIISLFFTVLPDEVFKCGIVKCGWNETFIILSNKVFVCLVLFILINLFYYFYYKNRKAVTISDKHFSIKIEYADLFKIKEGKKVINFDECFSTNVGNKPGDIKPNSICGQYLTNYPIEDMQALIKTSGINPIGISQYNNHEKYALGTLIPRFGFLLMAFAKLDEEGLGHLSYSDYLESLSTLWNQIDLYHGTDDVYLPILGSRITRFDKDLTQQELLDIMIASYRLSPKKLKKPNTLHIVCKEREGFSLNRVFGVN